MVKLECITNMHVGSGDINYNIIDQEVERDPVTWYPTINSSGVKGALREYFESKKEDGRPGITDNLISCIFGSEKPGNTTPGRLKFLGADMITMPARASSGGKPYYLVTTQTALDIYCEKSGTFFEDGADIGRPQESGGKMSVEEIPLKTYCRLFGQELYLVKDEDFKKIPLPVVARNNLENGRSKHLWYEEVVPHRSIFAFPVLAEKKDAGILRDFQNIVDGQVIQFGGNASIGYGLCRVSVIKSSVPKETDGAENDATEKTAVEEQEKKS